MDDADSILFLGLRDALGTVLPERVSSPKDVDADLLVAVCAACLRTTAPEQPPPPERLPPDMAGRFRVGTDLAARIKQLGYRGDLGFHQLLYPNETEVRRVLVFLLDTLPKVLPAAVAAAHGGPETTAQRVQAALKAWVISGGEKQATVPVPFWTCALDASRTDALVTAQAEPQARLAPSLLEFVAASAVAGEGAESGQVLLRLSRGSAAEQAALRKAALRAAVNEALRSGGAAEPASLRRELAPAVLPSSPAARMASAAALEPTAAAEPDAQALAGSRLERMEAELVRIQIDIQQALADTAAAEQRCVEHDMAVSTAKRDAAAASASTPGLEQEYLLRKQTVAMLSSGTALEDSERDLQNAVEAARKRMVALEAEWAATKAPLEERLAARCLAAERRRQRAEEQLRQMAAMRLELQEMVGNTRQREEDQRRLLAQYEAAPKGLNRSAFVKRIMEIVRNVKKQEDEIVRIAADTRAVQRDINAAQSALTRAYALVDETIFRDAKREDSHGSDMHASLGGTAKEAYRLLTNIHAAFTDLAAKVDDAGRAAKQLRDIEAQLEEMAKRPLDLERVLEDIAKVQGGG